VALDPLLNVIGNNDPFCPGKAQSSFRFASGSNERYSGVSEQFCHFQPILPRGFKKLLGHLRRGNVLTALPRLNFFQTLKS
jgi:hypothetical protein